MVTTELLDSIRGIFFGTDDERLKRKGVYKIRGFEYPYKGGDGEPLICPMDWAEKTRICTREGLMKVVAKTEYNSETIKHTDTIDKPKSELNEIKAEQTDEQDENDYDMEM